MSADTHSSTDIKQTIRSCLNTIKPNDMRMIKSITHALQIKYNRIKDGQVGSVLHDNDFTAYEDKDSSRIY